MWQFEFWIDVAKITINTYAVVIDQYLRQVFVQFDLKLNFYIHLLVMFC